MNDFDSNKMLQSSKYQIIIDLANFFKEYGNKLKVLNLIQHNSKL